MGHKTPADARPAGGPEAGFIGPVRLGEVNCPRRLVPATATSNLIGACTPAPSTGVPPIAEPSDCPAGWPRLSPARGRERPVLPRSARGVRVKADVLPSAAMPIQVLQRDDWKHQPRKQGETFRLRKAGLTANFELWSNALDWELRVVSGRTDTAGTPAEP